MCPHMNMKHTDEAKIRMYALFRTYWNHGVKGKTAVFPSFSVYFFGLLVDPPTKTQVNETPKLN